MELKKYVVILNADAGQMPTNKFISAESPQMAIYYAIFEKEGKLTEQEMKCVHGVHKTEQENQLDDEASLVCGILTAKKIDVDAYAVEIRDNQNYKIFISYEKDQLH